MTIRKNEAVTIGPIGILRVMPHCMEIKQSENVGHSERSGRMPRTGGNKHFDDRLTNIISLQLQCLDLFVVKVLHEK